MDQALTSFEMVLLVRPDYTLPPLPSLVIDLPLSSGGIVGSSDQDRMLEVRQALEDYFEAWNAYDPDALLGMTAEHASDAKVALLLNLARAKRMVRPVAAPPPALLLDTLKPYQVRIFSICESSTWPAPFLKSMISESRPSVWEAALISANVSRFPKLSKVFTTPISSDFLNGLSYLFAVLPIAPFRVNQNNINCFQITTDGRISVRLIVAPGQCKLLISLTF